MKRPQSAVTRMDDATTTTSKFMRPLSGVTDTTHRFNSTSVEQLVSKANYSLQLRNINDSLALYEQAFKLAAHQMSSIRLIKLLEDVVVKLIHALKQSDDKFVSQQILNKLLSWSQVTQSYDELLYIKCPPLIQVRVLNSYGDYLRRTAKYEESNNYLQLSLQMISSYKHEQAIDDLIGHTYLLLSTNTLYQQNYAQAIKEAQSALQHLQQAALNMQNEELHENICDCFINIGIAKEHEKQYQEAHYNYYSGLVYAQQNLNDERQLQIQQIYDQFLSRQATYLQKLTFQKQKSLKGLNTSQSGSKKSAQPFIEIVKNMQETKLSSQFFKKKQKIIQSIERQKSAKEQKSLQKFRPYMNKLQQTQPMMSLRLKSYKSKTPIKTNFVEKQIIQNQGVRILKVSKQHNQSGQFPITMMKQQHKQSQSQQQQQQQKQQNTQQQQQQQQYQQQQQQQQPQTPSQFISYLENLIYENKYSKIQNITQLQQFANIHLPSIEDSNQRGAQIIFQGCMTIYLFQTQSILYFQYFASEISNQFSLNAQNSKQVLIGMSLNICDICNQFNASNQDIIGQRTFLLNFSIEYFKYAKININSQSFQLPYSNSRQFYIPEQSVLVQMKNDYESLIFLVDQPENNQDIQPLLHQQRSSKSVLSDDIQPLLIEQVVTNTQHEHQDIQPILGITEEDKQMTDYSEDFEPVPLIEQKQEQPIRYNGMEKFTIKIESEDQQQEVIEVYADKNKQQQDNQNTEEEFDEELNNAAKLIQQKFRNKKLSHKI